MAKPKLIGSAPTLDTLKERTCKYLYSAVEFVQGTDPDTWMVHNSRGPVDGFLVRKVRGRYRLEMISEAA
jgi:hypothetical protein